MEYNYDRDLNYSWYNDYNFNSMLEDEHEHHMDRTMMVLRSLQAFATAVALMSNSVLLYLLASSRQRCVSNMYLLQRSVAVLIGSIASSVNLVIHYSDLSYSSALCSALTVVQHVSVIANLFSFMMFTVDSYLMSRPQHHTPAYRRKVLQLTSAGIWLLAAAVGVVSYFLTYSVSTEDNVYCMFAPLFSYIEYLEIVSSLFIQFVLPVVVVWVFVSVTFPPLPNADAATVPKTEECQQGPNRRLLLGLATTFTLSHGLYWFVFFLNNIMLTFTNIVQVLIIAYALPSYEMAISPILVICLSKELWERVVSVFLPRHRSAALPLQDL